MKVNAIVEIPQGSYCKYEHDKQDGSLFLDRMLNQPVPYSYGYIPGTLCGDGDPLDVYIIADEAIHPLTKLKIEIVGALICTDNGQSDDKLLAVVAGETRYPAGFGSRLIQSYLETYKTGFVVNKIVDKNAALEIYNASVEAYNKKLMADIEASKGKYGLTNEEDLRN